MAEIKECCQQAKNLYEMPDDRKNIVVRKCKVCACRHIEITVEPGELGVFGGAV